MTRMYWSFHAKYENIITNNSHIAGLIINSFIQPELDIKIYTPYMLWKEYLSDNPLPCTSTKTEENQP